MIPHFFKARLQDFLISFGQLQDLLCHKTMVTPAASAEMSSSSLHLSLPILNLYFCTILSNHFRAFLGLCTVLTTSQVFSHSSKSSIGSLSTF